MDEIWFKIIISACSPLYTDAKCSNIRVLRWRSAPAVFLVQYFAAVLPDIGFDSVFVAFFKFPPPWPAALHVPKDPSLFSAFYKDRIWPVCGGIFAHNWQFSQHQCPAPRAWRAGFCWTNALESTAATAQTPTGLWSPKAGAHQAGVRALNQQLTGRCNTALGGTGAAGC